jgi:hypothetical protein
MPYPHTIRLRGPWQFTVLSCTTGRFANTLNAELSQGRVVLPADWGDTLGADFCGRVRYTRHFNRPSGLDPHERVWCVIEGIDPAGNVALNDQPLGSVRGYALPESFDITPLLQERNQLTLDVEMPPLSQTQTPRPGRGHLPGGPVGEVRLEIRAGYFVSGLSVVAVDVAGTPELHVAGQIVGQVGSARLTVVVNAFERELLYGEFLPGEVFHLHATAAELSYREANGVDCELAAVEIRLLSGGAAVWQTVRETAVERLVWNAASQNLTIAGATVAFPVETFPVTNHAPDRQLLARLQKQPTAIWGSQQVLSEAWYTALDRHNLRVVQAMPAAWAAEVSPRLAHHPSIVAWVAESDDWDGLSDEFQTQGSFGRPWLKAEAVFGSDPNKS